MAKRRSTVGPEDAKSHVTIPTYKWNLLVRCAAIFASGHRMGQGYKDAKLYSDLQKARLI